MTSQSPAVPRKHSRLPWVIFAVGLACAPVAWLVWLDYVGTSWWNAYRDGGVGHAADRTKNIICGIGIVVGTTAPFFSSLSVSRKLGFSLLAALAGFGAAFLAGLFMILFVVGV